MYANMRWEIVKQGENNKCHTRNVLYTNRERERESASYFVHVQPVPGNIDKPTIKKRDREREKTNQRNKDKCSKKNRKKKSYKWKANE